MKRDSENTSYDKSSSFKPSRRKFLLTVMGGILGASLPHSASAECVSRLIEQRDTVSLVFSELSFEHILRMSEEDIKNHLNNPESAQKMLDTLGIGIRDDIHRIKLFDKPKKLYSKLRDQDPISDDESLMIIELTKKYQTPNHETLPAILKQSPLPPRFYGLVAREYKAIFSGIEAAVDQALVIIDHLIEEKTFGAEIRKESFTKLKNALKNYSEKMF